MTFGVGVAGPSDFQFWHKVLHKHFRGCRFDVRNMKNRDKLIRETPKLLDTFRDCHYAAAIKAVIPGCTWSAPTDTSSVAKGKLRSLVKNHLGRNASFNEIDFAKTIAPKFDPGRAPPHSASFRYFWELMESTARRQ